MTPVMPNTAAARPVGNGFAHWASREVSVISSCNRRAHAALAVALSVVAVHLPPV